MVKEAVDVGGAPQEEIDRLAALYGFQPPVQATKLYGGFSGANYKITDTKGEVAVLKIQTAYPFEEVAHQAAVQGYIGKCGFKNACSAIPLEDGQFLTTSVDGGVAVMLTFCEGKAADAVIESGVDAVPIMRAVGENLAGLHALPNNSELRTYMAGGAVNLREQCDNSWLELFRSNEHVRAHPYVPFYEAHLRQLQAAVKAQGLPQGIMHGDAFLDNILVDPTTGQFKAFVDFEDACTGPLLFDLACCAIGTCFKAEDNTLDEARLAALLEGYCATRPLLQVEVSNMVEFMKAGLLCNCSWRFKNFNIDHREVESARDSYKELQDRIVLLERPDVEASVKAILAKHGASNAGGIFSWCVVN